MSSACAKKRLLNGAFNQFVIGRVVDVEAIVQQLPDVLQSHRDHIHSLREAVADIQKTAATKTELSAVEKELSVTKWAFITLFGVTLTLIGWIFNRVF